MVPTSRLLIATVGLSLLLVACGDDDEGTDTAAGQSGTTQATTAPPATTAAPTTTTTQATTAVVRAVANERFGTILTDSAGKALYTWDRDTSATSTCTGTCATTWPPHLLPAGASTPIPNPPGVTGTLTGSARPDGAGTQVVWNGKPLYRYAGDVNPGEVNGDGVGGTWHVAKL